MAQKIGSLYASLDLESANFLNGLKNATRATDRAATSIDKAMLKVSTAVKGFVAVWAANNAIQGAQKLMELADAGKKLEGQLRLATDGFGSYGQAQKDVQRIAAETRADLNETGMLYAKNSRGVKELGGSQQQAALMTENFNKALKVGNAKTQESASAMLAWGQAMNSGKMEGEDYNSIIDASPPLIEALARALGKPIGEMKKLVEEGKVTGQVMMDALTKPEYTQKLIDDFQKVPKTWEETVTLIENQAQTLVTAFDRGSGLSNAIVDLFQSGVDGATDMGRSREQGHRNACRIRSHGTDHPRRLRSSGRCFRASTAGRLRYVR
ncbi:tape measure protein [Sphingomonas xinjiangensis]|uniref:Tape measure domain-containing protein n=1 Tax=Sphingomonas xinjiangensis TaxID=643568 RepID=A0A840YP38_9SPHN|nr:tape measure protein [Sphingomonas xinjiangensis]MBB5709442.1 tape measure domain-containing protein [Sphingomonas xinjiangensis]